MTASESPEHTTNQGFQFGPELAQLSVVLLWSSTYVVAKAAFTQLTPLAFIFARFSLTLILALAVLLLRRRGAERMIARRDWGRFIMAGLTGYTLYQLAFVLGLDRTSPFSSSLLVAMTPLFTLIILAVLGEPTSRLAWVGLVVALVGVVIFLLDKRDVATGTMVGDLLSLGAALAFALYGVITRPLVRTYPTETYAAWSVLTGSVPLLLVSLPAATAQPWPSLPADIWLSIVYLAVFPVYIAYILWNWAISRRGIATASSFSLLVPISSGILSALFFGEEFGPAKLLGAVLVLAGLGIVRLRPVR